MNALTGYIRDQLTDSLTAADIAGDCVVTRQEISGPSYDPTITNVDYPASGWVDNYASFDHVDSAVQVNDRRVYVLCSSLAITPVADNTVTIDSTLYVIISVQRDPAGACWVLQCRI